MSAAFVLRMFGALRLETGAESFTKFPTKRSALILARLAVSKDNCIGRDELAEHLWPDDFQDLTRLRLRQELRRLRQSVGTLDPYLRTDRQWIEVQPGCLDTDVHLFDEAIAASQSATDPQAKADSLSVAVAFLNGPFMAGFQDPWVLAIRRDYEEKARRAWLALAEALHVLGKTDEALHATMNAIRHAPLDIEANTSLIRRYVESGHVAQARQAFIEFDAMMFRELGRHAPQSVRAAIDGVPTDSGEAGAGGDSGARTAVARPLPLQGRTELLESIQAALSRPGACVLLVGPVGVGKTHLLKEAAWQFSRAHDLPIRLGGAPFSVMDGLFVPDPLLSRSDLIDSIHAAAESGWRVLCESRVRLESEGITEILVNPLPVPSVSGEAADIRANPSVQVLLSRVSEQNRATPNERDAKLLAEIARRLDGLPAALKIFASRLMIQTPEQVFRALEDGLAEYAQEVLSTGDTVGLAVLLIAAGLPDHSRDLLVALALLDGASVDLANRLAAPHNPVEEWRTLEKRCLISVQDDGPKRRYRVPHPIAFAIRNMAASEERDGIEKRTWHAVSDWVFEKSRLLAGPHQEFAFNAVQTELPNVLRAIEWAVDSDPALAGKLAVGAWRTVCARGNPSADAELLLRAARTGAPYLEVKWGGEAWLGAAIALTVGGRLDLAEGAFLEAIRVFQSADDANGEAWVTINYAESVVALSDMKRAIALSKQAADQTSQPDVRSLSLCFYAMGLAETGEVTEAVRVGEQVFASRLQSMDLTEAARSYGDLARLYRKVGRPEAADPLLREGVRRLRETGIQDMLLETLLQLAEMNLDSADSGDVLSEAGALADRIGSNGKLLEVARVRLAWASRQGDHHATIATVEDVFRFTQISQSTAERNVSLRVLAVELDRNQMPEYANALYAALGDPTASPIHSGWKALMSSDSHATSCVLAVVMAKEALSRFSAT